MTRIFHAGYPGSFGEVTDAVGVSLFQAGLQLLQKRLYG
jgi:hypothetical protein